jgi:hypothetical protein
MSIVDPISLPKAMLLDAHLFELGPTPITQGENMGNQHNI